MTETNNSRVLIVVFDALRPDFVTPDLMPNLCGFAGRGVRYLNSRSTFPTETRVNQSAVITGCYPTRHGIVANKFPEPEAAPGQVLNTGDDVVFEEALGRLKGPLLGVPTLGQRLATAGRSLATLSTGTSGGGRLINLDAEAQGNFRLAFKRPEAAAPAGVMAQMASRVGPIPEYGLPALGWVSHAVDCYLDFVEPEFAPDAMLLWLSEPDESCHHLGIGSEGMLRAIAHVDAEFGRILQRQSAAIEAGSLQVITLSDHGQISLEGRPLDLMARFRDASFAAAAAPTDDADCIVVVDNGGGVWVRDPDEQRIADLVQWMRGQAWCGPLFTRAGIADTLRHREIGLDHARAPDIVLALANHDGANIWGRSGLSVHDSGYPADGGCHGGLSTYELHTFLAMAGSSFSEGRTFETHAGNVDIAPTVLALLGLPQPDGMDGRALQEAFSSGKESGVDAVDREYASENGSGPATRLSVTEVCGTRYLNRAWVE